MGYSTVLFDLDGTLLDTLGDLAASVNFALGEMGYPGRTREQVRQMVGNGVASLIARAVPEGTSPADSERCLGIFRQHYSLHMNDTTAPYPGVLRLLEKLREQGVAAAVVSNKFDQAVKGLCGRWFPGLLGAAIGELPGRGRKPDPAMVEAALGELRRSREGTVYVGDSEPDILTAQNAGLPLVMVSWGFRGEARLRELGVQSIASSPEQLLELLLAGGR